MYKSYGKSRKLMSLFAMRPITLVVALCLFALAGFAAAETLDDCEDQTQTGQDFTFSFSPAERASGVEEGTLTLHVRGDYNSSNENLTWDIEGFCSGTASTASYTVIQNHGSNDVEWVQSYEIDLDCLNAATSDSSVTISVDLADSVNLFGEPFVCVELTYSSECFPPETPTSPNPPDGIDGISVETELAWEVVFPTHCYLANGGFEDGEFAPWTTIAGPGDELTPWNVTDSGTVDFPNGLPFEGAYFAQNGFDGDAGLFYDIYQETKILADANSAILNWSERIQWDMRAWGATLPREYIVTIQPAGGGPALATLHTVSLNPDTNGDTGYVPHSVDLLSLAPGIAGQIVRINFHQTIPESFTGPAQFDLDGIELVCNGTIVQREILLAPAQGSTIDHSQYDQLRQQSLARQNQLPGVRITEVGAAKNELPPPATSQSAPVMSVGGPDCGGYTFIDSDEPGGPAFDWIEIAGTGTNLNLTDDSFYWSINLPFDFDFYGTLHNQVAVSSNGTIQFAAQDPSLYMHCIPDATGNGANNFIAVYWYDLWPNGADQVYYEIVGSAPNRILVVEWDDVPFCCSQSNPSVTVQAQLFEGSNNILLLYADPSTDAGASATVGIQRDSGCGLQYLCRQSRLHSGLAVLFSRGPLDPCRGASTFYDVYFGSGDPDSMELIADDICEANFDPTPEPGDMLDGCTEYYWQVIVTTPCGTATGPVWNFKTGRQDGSSCNAPPDCSGAFPSVAEIWPPNRKWVDVEILGVIDPEGDPVSITITGITQDEPVSGEGSGTTIPDGGGIGTSTARLRAENKSKVKNGRIYEISFRATDTGGATCNGSVQVCVPYEEESEDDETPERFCIDDGQLFESTGAGLMRADLNGDGVINELDFTILAQYWLESYEIRD